MIEFDNKFQSEARRKLDMMIADGPFDLQRFDLAPNNPERYAEVADDPTMQFQRVELTVPRYGEEVKAMLPSSLWFVIEFIDEGWTPQENMHGGGFGIIRQESSLPPIAPIDMTVDPKFQRVGDFNKKHPGFEEVTLASYLFKALLNEKATDGGYDYMERLARTHDEPGLAEFYKRVSKQEGGHIGYYRFLFAYVWPRLSKTQQFVVRNLGIHGFDLVGIHSEDDRQETGRSLNVLLDGDDPQKIIDPVQALAQAMIGRKKLFSKEQKPLPPFVAKKVHKALQAA